MKRLQNLNEWTSRKPVEPGLLNGLSRRERTFILEKLIGMNDQDAALAAGYSRSMARNTKQKVWKPRVLAEFQRLQDAFILEVRKAALAELEAEEREENANTQFTDGPGPADGPRPSNQ